MRTSLLPGAALSLLLLVACGDSVHPFGVAASEDSGDAGSEVEERCEAGDVTFSDVEVAQTRVPTVLRVTWTTDVPGRAAVSWTGSAGAGASAQGPVETEHAVLVVGLPPDTAATLVPRLHIDGEVACGEPTDARTGPLPTTAPAISLEADDAALLDGGFVVTQVLSLDRTWIIVLDGRARLVWVWDPARDLDGSASPGFRAVADPDGRGIWFNAQANASWENGLVTLLSWDGRVLEQVAVPGGHTDFTLMDDGALAVLGWTIRELDGRRILGDTVVRVEADGSQHVIWDAFDHFSPDLRFNYPRGFLPHEPEVEDWSHANGISFDPASGDLLVSVAGALAITRIDGETGEERWRMGHNDSDFTTDDPLPPVDSPHSVSAVDGGVLLFNRRDWVRGTTCSEAVELAVDTDRGTVASVWTYDGESCEHVGFLGGAERLESGGTLVSWSTLGMLDVAAPDAGLRWRARTQLGTGFGFAAWAPTVGPADAP